MFTDPNEKARAFDRLRSLFQYSEEFFATFIPKFEREMFDAEGIGWSDEVYINYLKEAVNDKIRRGLVSVIQIPGKYHKYV
jgi:REP element-mobilizing transposase RayT